MHRSTVMVTLIAVILVCTIGTGRSVGMASRQATPMALDHHPLVGAWLLDPDTEDPENPPTLVTFTSDGIYTQHDPDGLDGIGSWDATGDTTANMTFVGQFFLDEEQETVGGTTVRAEIEVAEDGQTFTATYSVEFAGEGMPEGEYGPATAEGERILVEEMGTDLTPISEAFGGGAEEDGGTGTGEEGEGSATPPGA